MTAPIATLIHVDAPLAGGVANERLGRREIQERADRAARTLERPRLEHLREREEEDDRRRFRELAQQNGAGDRNRASAR